MCEYYMKPEDYEYPPKGVMDGAFRKADQWMKKNPIKWTSVYEVKLATAEKHLNSLGYSLWAE